MNSAKVVLRRASKNLTSSKSLAPCSVFVAPRQLSSSRLFRRADVITLKRPSKLSYSSDQYEWPSTYRHISPDQYHKLADRCLDTLTDCLEALTEEYSGPDADQFEAEYSSGVLNLRLGSNGTYVINKQPPNKQIWLSSPRSGPKRFDYDRERDTWFMIKEGEISTMRGILETELSQIFGRPILIDLDQL